MSRLAGAAAILAFAALVIGACGSGSPEPAPNTQPRPGETATADTPTPAPVNELAEGLESSPLPAELADGTFLGEPRAPLTLTVFEDFLCGHCLRFTALVEPMIIEEYVVPGKVRLEFRNWPILGTASVSAAAAAECAADQDQFWEYHRQLFLAHPEAGGERDGSGYSPQSLLAYAAELNLDTEEFLACFASDETIETLRANAAAARSAGLTGTPAFLINGEPIGSAPASLAAWRKLLDDRLAGR